MIFKMYYICRETFKNALCTCINKDWARQRRYGRQQSFVTRSTLCQPTQRGHTDMDSYSMATKPLTTSLAKADERTVYHCA